MTVLKKLAFFAAGTVFGSIGFKILSGKDAKNIYAHTTAAALRAKDSAMTTIDNISENAGDILAKAKEINLKAEEE